MVHLGPSDAEQDSSEIGPGRYGTVRQVRWIRTTTNLQKYQPAEILPGPQISADPDLLHAVGNIVTTIFHPVGTCRMGSDPDAEVGPDRHLRGLDGTRVVEASIMPRIVSGNTASPVIMIAEKAADMIRGQGN